MPFEVQGHRGARGLRPENTIPSFEAALDACVDSIETDLVLTGDGAIVLHHDMNVSAATCRFITTPGQPLGAMTVAELRGLVADSNPDPLRFPDQQPIVTPFSKWFADRQLMEPYAIPVLSDLFALAKAYAGDAGARFGKSDRQRASACRVIFDLEAKRVPALETGSSTVIDTMLAAIEVAGMTDRCRVRSFDHRLVQQALRKVPRLRGCVLIAGTAPLRPSTLAQDAGAEFYCPDHLFLDADAVREAHDTGLRVIPWTVNLPQEWERLLRWGVDGITTDFPERLKQFAG